jgi:hypothetical protein
MTLNQKAIENYSDSKVMPSFCFFGCSKRGTGYNLAPAGAAY